MPKQTPAADQFAGLGITPDQYTPAMQVAVKQKWSALRVDEKVADLRAAHAAVLLPPVPTVEEMLAEHAVVTGQPVTDDDRTRAEAEVVRLRRNAAVNAWRERTKLQAALDARDLKFAALRAKRGTAGAPRPGTLTGDAAPLSVAS